MITHHITPRLCVNQHMPHHTHTYQIDRLTHRHTDTHTHRHTRTHTHTQLLLTLCLQVADNKWCTGEGEAAGHKGTLLHVHAQDPAEEHTSDHIHQQEGVPSIYRHPPYLAQGGERAVKRG